MNLEELYSCPLEELPIVVLDLETTGLRPHLDAICEIGAVSVQGYVISGSYATLVNPQRSMPKEVIKIHHLTSEHLKDAPLLADILPEFLRFLGSNVIVGHNVGFDLSFLTSAALAWGVDLLKFPILDTAALARQLIPQQQSYSLVNLSHSLNLPNTRFHRALEDATTTAHLLAHLFQRAAEHNIYTLAQLEEHYPFRGVPRSLDKMTHLEQTVWKAITHKLKLNIKYKSRKNLNTLRCITPERLQPPYIHAYCHLRNEQRIFHLDRIEEYQLLDSKDEKCFSNKDNYQKKTN